MKSITKLAAIVFIFTISGCNITGDGLQDINPDICSDQVPIVMVHGLLASGDTYSKHVRRFMANGICKERMFAFDWNSIGFQNNTARLGAFINKIRQETGAPYVYLIGHSAGSSLSYSLLRFSLQSTWVDRYVHIGGSPRAELPGAENNIPTLNIYSDEDYVVTGGDIPGAINLNLIDKDHFEVATSIESFIAIYNFLYGDDPDVIDLFDPSETYEISGKALSFGENLPSEGATIKIYKVDPNTGFRLSAEPTFDLIAGDQGFWGPIEVEPETHYEFLIYTDLPQDRPVHYYFEPFRYDNPLVYLRSYPPFYSLGAVFLSGIPSSNDFATTAYFGASQSVVAGRDVLKVNDNTLSTEALTPAEEFIVAMFLYDKDKDEVSTFESDPSFAVNSFLAGVDYYIPAAPLTTIEMEFNGRTLNMVNWRSYSDGVSVGVYD